MVMVTIVAPSLLPYKLEYGEGAVLYSPQTLLRHMGYDHGTMIITGDSQSHLARMQSLVYQEGSGHDLGRTLKVAVAIHGEGGREVVWRGTLLGEMHRAPLLLRL